MGYHTKGWNFPSFKISLAKSFNKTVSRDGRRNGHEFMTAITFTQQKGLFNKRGEEGLFSLSTQ